MFCILLWMGLIIGPLHHAAALGDPHSFRELMPDASGLEVVNKTEDAFFRKERSVIVPLDVVSVHATRASSAKR